MGARLFRGLTLAVLALAGLLICTCESEARCRLFRRRQCQPHCYAPTPFPGTPPPAPAPTDLRCPKYYSGKIGAVHVHYGLSYSSGCTTNPGPVNLTRQVCFPVCMTCGFNLNYCVTIGTLMFRNYEVDGVEKDAVPDDHFNDKIVPGSEILGNFSYKGGKRPLRLVVLRYPDGTRFGLGYELGKAQDTDYKESQIHQTKSRLGQLEHEGTTYHVMLRNDVEP